MKLSFKDGNWIMLLQFAESFMQTAINNLEEKEKFVKVPELVKLKRKCQEFHDYLYYVNTKIYEAFDGMLEPEKADDVANLMLGLVRVIEEGANKPKSTYKLLKQLGFYTELDIKQEREMLKES